jgi:hypothetical protein
MNLWEAAALIEEQERAKKAAAKAALDHAKAAIRNAEQRDKLIAALAPSGVNCLVYAGSQSPAVFACAHGHVFEARGSDIRAGKTGCPVCRAEARHAKDPSPSSETALAAAKLQAEDLADRAAAAAKAAAADHAAALAFMRKREAEMALKSFLVRTGRDDETKIQKEHEKRINKAPKDKAPKDKAPKGGTRGRKPAKVRPTAEVLSPGAAEMLEVLGVQVLTTEMARGSDPADLRCVDCGHEWREAPTKAAGKRVGCPLCDGSVGKLKCQVCGHVAVYPTGAARRSARREAYEEMIETRIPAKFVPAFATCEGCGADIQCPRRAPRRPSYHVDRVRAADALILQRIDEDHQAAVAAVNVLNEGASMFSVRVQDPGPSKRSLKQRRRAGYLISRSRKPVER